MESPGGWPALMSPIGGTPAGFMPRWCFSTPRPSASPLRFAVEFVLRCARGYRLPEPTRQAHLLSNRIRLEDDVSRR
ncbi:MAG: hypothetical protein C0614_13800 [Desulfuromonas sp.]|nr:MAG: hypothetical protein C0614_13800 [Desulfuromonas sp.]